jgi:phosphoglycerol transferase MdoB-like AlkP superfamily enzyme
MKKKLTQFAIFLYAYMLIIFSVLRIIFLFENKRFFIDISKNDFARILWVGFRYDTSTIFFPFLISSVIYLFYIKTANIKYLKAISVIVYLFMFCLIFFSFFDTLYYSFSFQRINISTLHIVGDSLSIVKTILYSEWKLLALCCILIILSHYMWRALKNIFLISSPQKTSLIEIVMVFTFSLFTFWGGGVKALSPISAPLFINANFSSIVLNPIQTLMYSVFRSENQKQIETPQFSSIDSARKSVNFIQLLNNKKENRLNVIIFIMESFSRAYLEKNNYFKVHTPFLDSIIKESLHCTNAYANGSMSISGIQSVLTGIPPIYYPNIDNSPYYMNFLRGMPAVFKERGYETIFYYGANKDHFGLEKFTKKTGIEQYVSGDNYRNQKEHNGYWGINDSAFFSYVLSDIKYKKQPFFSVIYNLSTHYPYVIPDQYQHLFPTGNSLAAKSISFYDRCLKNFFETSRNYPWYNNTVFVFVADHWNKEDKALSGTDSRRFEIPLFFYKPDKSLRYVYNGVVDQTCIFPTLLDITGYSKKFTSFGKSIFDSTEKRWTVAQKELPGLLLFTDASSELQFDAVTGKTIKVKSLNKSNLTNYSYGDLEKTAKSFVQYYSYLFINNKLADTTINLKK